MDERVEIAPRGGPVAVGDARVEDLRATLALANRDTGQPAPAWSALVRFAVRWRPIRVWELRGLLLVAHVEVATMLIRPDRRSLAGLLARTRTTTHNALLDASPRTDQDPAEPASAA